MTTNTTNTNNTASLIVKYQNIICFAVCSISAINLCWTNNTNAHHNFSTPIFFIYFLVDWPFAKKDLKIHHFLGALLILFKWRYGVAVEHDWHITKMLYKTEISTIFLVFKYWIPDKYKIATNINNILFASTFFKFRIHEYYINVIANPTHYELLEIYTQHNWGRCIFLYSSLYGIYALNWYWFTIICKMIYKSTIRKLITTGNAILLQHNTTSLLYLFNLITVCYVYSKQPNDSYLFDVFGIGVLCYANYKYHNKSVNYYNQNGIITPTEKKNETKT